MNYLFKIFPIIIIMPGDTTWHLSSCGYSFALRSRKYTEEIQHAICDMRTMLGDEALQAQPLAYIDGYAK